MNYKATREHQWIADSAPIPLGNGTRKEALLGGASSGTRAVTIFAGLLNH
jgi:hypothetical protein